jgi:adenosine deaminase
VARLAGERMALTVCPLSNLRLRVIDELIHHPLRRMMDKGLVVSVNSDDPAYFGGYVNDNFRAVAGALSLTPEEIVALVRNGFEASLMPPAEKLSLLAEVDRVLTTSAFSAMHGSRWRTKMPSHGEHLSLAAVSGCVVPTPNSADLKTAPFLRCPRIRARGCRWRAPRSAA